jgi:hypothetical protein
MSRDLKFEHWKSRVEFHLELMAKKTMGDFNWYNYHADYANKVEPVQTAARVIRENHRRLKWQKR